MLAVEPRRSLDLPRRACACASYAGRPRSEPDAPSCDGDAIQHLADVTHDTQASKEAPKNLPQNNQKQNQETTLAPLH